MRRALIVLISGLAAAAAVPLAASAEVLVTIDKATQRMTVAVDGQERYVWRVSTGVADHDTPSGSYTPFRMDRDHFSREWDDAPMPNSIFFTGMGHAIHGTGHVAALGRPASHGCVRLSVADSARLFALVKAEGMGNTRVVVEGEDASPGVSGVEQARYGRDVDDIAASRPHRRHPAADTDGSPFPDDAAYDDDRSGLY